MRRAIRTVGIGGLSFAIFGCADVVGVASFDVIVRGPESSRSVEVEGRKVTTTELQLIARNNAKSGHRAHIVSDMADTSYRCVGGVIYALQVASSKDVSFVAKPLSGALPPAGLPSREPPDHGNLAS